MEMAQTLFGQFCFDIIGNIIEKELPPRVRQLVMNVLFVVMRDGRPVVRDIDDSDYVLCEPTGFN